MTSWCDRRRDGLPEIQPSDTYTLENRTKLWGRTLMVCWGPQNKRFTGYKCGRPFDPRERIGNLQHALSRNVTCSQTESEVSNSHSPSTSQTFQVSESLPAPILMLQRCRLGSQGETRSLSTCGFNLHWHELCSFFGRSPQEQTCFSLNTSFIQVPPPTQRCPCSLWTCTYIGP